MPFVTDPNRTGALVHILFWTVATALVCLVSDSLRAEDRTEVDRVDAAIVVLLDAAPRHPLIVNPAARRTWAEAFVRAGGRHGIDPYLLAVVAKRESTFRSSAMGGIGEKTAMQILPNTARRYGCDVSTLDGAVDCAAEILAERRRVCGTIEQALAAYASRGQCSGYRKSKKLKRIADSRLKKAADLRGENEI